MSEIGSDPQPTSEQRDVDVAWLESYDEAVELSELTGKPILADFTGSDWCGYCIKLKDEIFLTPEFETWARENVILLELDYPRGKFQSPDVKAQNRELADRFGITSYPTVLFLDSGGNQIGTKMGYQRGGPSNWIDAAESQLR